MLRKIVVALLLALALPAIAQAVEKMELKNEGRKWTLLVDGKPYYLRGVTWGVKVGPDIDERMRELRDMGVTTIRTWGVGGDTQTLLDAAHKHGITVMLGLWMRHGRSGAEGDDNFNWISDEAGKKRQFDNCIDAVKKYKDHPALLFWGVGNEVILNIATDAEKHAYAKFLGGLLREIKKIDPVHLTCSAGAWTLPWPYWKEHCPDLDVYGVNTYGAGATALPDEEKRLGVNKPYVLTEFGPRGEWDAPKDKNGLRQEPQDDEKYRSIVQGWNEWIRPKEQCLGVYFFNYSINKEPSHPSLWLSTIIGGKKRPGYWAVREALSGKKPEKPAPEITEMRLPRDAARKGSWVPVRLQVRAADKGKLDVRFVWNQRLDRQDGASREERDKVRPLEFRGDLEKGYEIKIPDRLGLLKIYALVSDDQSLSSRYASFIATADDPGKDEQWGRKVDKFPFYVYQDENGEKHYVPSGMMAADMGKVRIDYNCAANPHSGKSCVRVSSAAGNGWFGMAYQEPANDWGEKAGGFDLTGAKKLTLWARGEKGGEKVKFGVGMIAREKKFYDTLKVESPENVLTKEWKQYVIDLSGCDLRRVKTGFTWFSGAAGGETTFYLDEIRFEE